MTDEKDEMTFVDYVDQGEYGQGLWSDHILYDQVADYIALFENDDEGYTKTDLCHAVAVKMVQFYHIAYPPKGVLGWGPCLWRYDPDIGVYRDDGARFLESQMTRLMGSIFTDSNRKETLNYIRNYAEKSKAFFATPREHMVVRNGILNVTTGELHDFSPQEPHQTRIDVKWPDNPEDATYDKYDEFVRSLVNPDDVPTIYRLLSHMLYKGYPSSKAAMFAGDGSNGKSTLLSTFRRFIHPGDAIANNDEVHKNVSSESLQDLASPQKEWAEASLHGSLANIDPDMGSGDVKHTSKFKQATGGKDPMSANEKYERTFEFVNHATLIFAVNEVPMADDDSDAYWRRWIYINFPHKFKEGDGDYVDEDELIDSVTTDEQKSGLLVRCVEELKRWKAGDKFYPEIADSDEVRREMKKASDSVYAFATECIDIIEEGEDVDDDWIAKDALKNAYRKFCDDEQVPRVTDTTFEKRILNIKDVPIETGQSRQVSPGTGRDGVYKPITFTPRGWQIVNGGGDGSENGGEQTQIERDFGGVNRGYRQRVADFFDRFVMFEEDALIQKSELRDFFMEEVDYIPEVEGEMENAFNTAVSDMDEIGTMRTTKVGPEGKQTPAYTGIRLKTDSEIEQEDLERAIGPKSNGTVPKDSRNPTTAAAKAVTVVRKSDDSRATRTELIVELSQAGFEVEMIDAGIEKALNRGDLQDHGSELTA